MYIATSCDLCFFFAQDCYEVVQKTTLVILQRLQQILSMEVGMINLIMEIIIIIIQEFH